MDQSTCARCNAPFAITRPNRRFCSSACQVVSNREDVVAKRRARHAATAARTCPGCGVEFERVSRQKFCSRKCQTRMWQRKHKGIEDPGFIRQCWWCHADFKLLDGRRDYCSRECARFGGLLGNVYRKYGITRDKYRALYFHQQGVCAICGEPERTERNALLAVDHDHVTGQVRGLLCSHCNRAIGLLRDDPEVIERAALYVKENRQMKLEIT